jgi:triosephosphate isomerase
MSGSIVKYPLIIVNLKTYKEGMSEKAIFLSKEIERVNEKTGITIVIVPQIVDLQAVAESGDTPVFAQHVDNSTYGKFTGHVLPESVAEAGAIGTLINHSEKQISNESIEATIRRAENAELMTVVCVDTIEKAQQVALYNPDAIAIEPPELIGSGIPVSKAQPEIVEGSVVSVKKINSNVKVLCGAGITNGEDAAAAIRLGADGILVASGVVKSKDPYVILLELARALQG